MAGQTRIFIKAAIALSSIVCPVGQAQVVGAGNFIHVVADLDKTIQFYRDEVGLELTGPAGPRAFSKNAVVENLYDANGSESRVAGFKIPGSPVGLEFVEFKGISQKPARRTPEDPGASLVTIPTDRKRPGAPIQDPDGFFVALTDPNSPVRLSLTVADSARTLDLFRDQLGLQSGKVLTIPGTSFELELIKGRNRGKATAPSIHDPGSGVLRLLVHNEDALFEKLKAAGVPVVSAGGQQVSLGTRKAVIFRDPDGFFLQLFSAPE